MPAGAEPLVGEGLTEQVGVKVRNSGLPGATVEQVPQPEVVSAPLPSHSPSRYASYWRDRARR